MFKFDKVQSLEQRNRLLCSGYWKEIKRRERRKQLYKFLPQSGSGLIPLALPRRAH